MKKWNDYKKTYRTESDIFDFARVGDLRGFANLLYQSPTLDLNAKNQKGYSALMLAVYNGEKDFCEALLRGGADVHSTDSMGNTVLMGSAYKGDLAILKLLLEFGAKLTDTNKTHMTARDWAVMFKRAEIIEYLDTSFPDTVSSSKLRNFFRFIQLSLYMVKERIYSGRQR